MAFKITIRKIEDFPATRHPTASLPIPWSELYMSYKKDKDFGFDLPVKEFWVGERHVDPTKIDPGKLQERVRQSFYNWRAGQEKELNKGRKAKDKAKYLGVGLEMGNEFDDAETPALASIFVRFIPQDDAMREAAAERAKIATASRRTNAATSAPPVTEAIKGNDTKAA